MTRNQEKINREIRVLLQNSLYKQLKEKSEKEYKTISEVIRYLVVEYLKLK